MDKESDIEAKYQRLAAEYSKVRSQATVLKKAVLDEQTKNVELSDLLKNCEQTARKRDQEMESLSFRNEQLTKRIMVLQQELLSTNNTKKGKNKSAEVPVSTDISVLNEELQKKILENAQLFSSIADKETEMAECKEKIRNLEEMITNLQNEMTHKERNHSVDQDRYKKGIQEMEKMMADLSSNSVHREKSSDALEKNAKFWQMEAERWKTECELIKSKPDSEDKLTDYYESQLSRILETNVMLQSETKTIYADNMALMARLENTTSELFRLKNNLETSYEELITTNNNYKSQLDAMTEHLVAQNDKITKQCDEIQILKHRLSIKK